MANLVRRSDVTKARRQYILPKDLTKRKLSLKERAYIWWDAATAVIATGALALGIVLEAQVPSTPQKIEATVMEKGKEKTEMVANPEFSEADDGVENWYEVPMIVFGGIILFGYLCSVGARYENTEDSWRYDNRKKAVEYDRNRRLAPHAEDRIGRYLDVEYSQYSVWPTQQGDKLVFKVMEHTKPSKGFGIYTQHKFSKKGYSQGDYSDHLIYSQGLSNPTLDEAIAARDKAEDTASALEQSSYTEAIDSRKVERLVHLTRRPDSPTSHQALAVRDEIEAMDTIDMLLKEDHS